MAANVGPVVPVPACCLFCSGLQNIKTLGNIFKAGDFTQKNGDFQLLWKIWNVWPAWASELAQ
jgi:hypothetical protein